MEIQGIAQIHGPHGIQGPHSNRGTAASQNNHVAQTSDDQLDISPAAEAAVEAAEQGELRSELVARVRNEIAAGTYETSDKLAMALDGMLDELG